MIKKGLIIFTIILSLIFLVSCTEEIREGNRVTIKQTITITNKVSWFDKIFKKEEATTTIVEVEQEVFINPKRVASFSHGATDMLNTVGLDKAGIELFGLAKGTNLPNSLSMFEDSKYPNIGTLFEENLDVLDLLNPELIILDGRSASLYTKLNNRYKNADIIDVSNNTYSLEKHNEVVKVLGLIFTNVKDDLDLEISKINAKFDNFNKETTNINALFLLSNGSSISTYNKSSRYGVIFNEFGFKEANPDTIVSGSHGDELSMELIKKINPAIIFILDRTEAVGGESGYNDLLNIPLFKSLDAVKNDLVFKLDVEAWYLVTGGFTSVNQMISDIEKYTINA